MKVIQYHLIRKVNLGTPASPDWQDVPGAAVELEYTQANLEVAKAEAWQGLYTIGESEEDPQPSPQEDIDAMLIDHEYRLMLLEQSESGV